jgi:hypothetical protein
VYWETAAPPLFGKENYEHILLSYTKYERSFLIQSMWQVPVDKDKLSPMVEAESTLAFY